MIYYWCTLKCFCSVNDDLSLFWFLILCIFLHVERKKETNGPTRRYGLYSLRRHRLIVIGIPIMHLGRSSGRLRFIMGIPIPVIWSLVLWIEALTINCRHWWYWNYHFIVTCQSIYRNIIQWLIWLCNIWVVKNSQLNWMRYAIVHHYYQYLVLL